MGKWYIQRVHPITLIEKQKVTRASLRNPKDIYGVPMTHTSGLIALN